MPESVLSQRYARAVLGLAAETDDPDIVGDQLAELAAVCLADRQTIAFWRTHRVPADDKRQALQDVLEAMDASAVVRNTANLLLDRGRFEILGDLVASYRRLNRERARVIDAVVASAVELDEAAIDRVRQGLEARTGRSVRIEAEVDPELIGGLRVRMDHTVIDGSVAGRLRALGRRFQ